MNELLQKQIALKESKVTHLKDKTVCTIRGKDETCIDVDNQNKFNNISTILDEILTNRRSPEDKNGIGYLNVKYGV